MWRLFRMQEGKWVETGETFNEKNPLDPEHPEQLLTIDAYLWLRQYEDGFKYRAMQA